MAAPTRVISAVSYNLHKGLTAGNRRFVLSEIRDALRQVSADIIFLQEVVGCQDQRGLTRRGCDADSQFEYLADSLWDHYAYGRNAVTEGRDHGNAILSKFPIIDYENIDLSLNRWEQRGFLHATIAIPGRDDHLHAGCLHLNLLEHHRRRQVGLLQQRILAAIPRGVPTIVAGDFNDWRGRTSRVLRDRTGLEDAYSWRHGQHARTFPALFPLLPLDRIYTRDVEILDAVVLGGARFQRLSDHLGLHVTMALQAPAA